MKYFAFISYSHKDFRAARFIQGELEHFRHANLRIRDELRPNDAKFVREIYRDRTGLSGKAEGFERELEKSLSESRYLIVVCSPEVAERKGGCNWIQWEIETFRRLHGDDADSRIIPVIAGGDPDLTDASCLPLPLRREVFAGRNLPDMRVHDGHGGFWARRKAWHSAVITLLSYVFDVERQAIEDRFAVERARARLRNGSVAALMLFLLCGSLGWAWHENERKKDMESWVHFTEAQHLLEQVSPDDAFGKADRALAHLSLALRMSVARDYLVNQIAMRSWIVPEGCCKEQTIPKRKLSGGLIVVPEDFPLSFSLVTNTTHALSAHVVGECFKRIWRTDPFFSVLGGEVSPVGNVLAVHVRHPDYAIVGMDPFTGRELWRKRTGGLLQCFSFSKDGRYLAVLSRTGQLSVLKAETGTLAFETCCVGESAKAMLFSDAGDRLFVYMKSEFVNMTISYRLMRFVPKVAVSTDGFPILHCEVNERSFTLISQTGSNYGTRVEFDRGSLERISMADVHGAIPHDNCNEIACATNEDATVLAVATRQAEIQLLTAKHGKPICDAFEMPQSIHCLRFARLAGREFLIVGGGSKFLDRKFAEGFYAIIDPEQRKVVCLHSRFPGRVSRIYPISKNRILLHGDNNAQDYVITLPSAEGFGNDELKTITVLLSGRLPNADQVSLPGLRLLSNSKTGNLWSKVVGRMLADPDDLQGYLSDWVGYCQKAFKSEYARLHPWNSPQEVDARFSAMSVQDWRLALMADVKLAYVADKFTDCLLKLTPDSELAKKERESCLRLFGKMDSIRVQDKDATMCAWRQFVSSSAPDIFEGYSILYQAAAAASGDQAEFSSVLGDAAAMLAAQIKDVRIESGMLVPIVRQIGTLKRFAGVVSLDDIGMCAYFDTLIKSTESARPKIQALQLRSDLLKLKLQHCIATGDRSEAFIVRERLSAEHDYGNDLQRIPGYTSFAQKKSSLGVPTLEFLDVFLPLLRHDGTSSRKLYDAHVRGMDGAFAEVVNRMAWVMLSELKRHKVNLGEMQMVLDALDASLRQGVRITKVTPGNWADRQGWREGDRIVAINGITVYDADMLNTILGVHLFAVPDDELEIELSRNGKPIVVRTKEKKLGFDFNL